MAANNRMNPRAPPSITSLLNRNSQQLGMSAASRGALGLLQWQGRQGYLPQQTGHRIRPSPVGKGFGGRQPHGRLGNALAGQLCLPLPAPGAGAGGAVDELR